MRTIDARNAFVMTSLLQEVTRIGTAAKAQAAAQAPRHLRQDRHHQRLDGRLVRRLPAEAWWPWSGSATTRRASSATRETGGGLALPVWIEYMAHALKGVPVQGTARRPTGVSTSAATGSTRNTRHGARRRQPGPGGQAARRRRPRTSARASSTCSGADRRGRGYAPTFSGLPACALAHCATARRRIRCRRACRASAPSTYR